MKGLTFMCNDINYDKLSVKGFMRKVEATKIEKNTLGIFWLGQAGFIIKTPRGSLLAIDPYLSDCCERLVGFKRIMLPVLTIDEMDVDYLFVSHEHPDHFDIDMIDEIKRKGQLKFFGPVECEKIALKIGIQPDNFIRLEENKPIDFSEFRLLPVKADHGEQSSDALGFIFDFGFTRVYFAGDTAYSPDILKKVYEMRPEIALLPVNGEYGNLNSEEAAKLAKDIGSKVVIPCHYWTFIEHGSYPLQLKKIMEEKMSEVKLVFLAQGEGYIYDLQCNV